MQNKFGAMLGKYHTEYLVKYKIDYESGKSWYDSRKVVSYSELGAIKTVKWIYSSRKLIILDVIPLKITSYFGYPDNHTITDN